MALKPFNSQKYDFSSSSLYIWLFLALVWIVSFEKKSQLETQTFSHPDGQSPSQRDRGEAACPAGDSLHQSHRCRREIPLKTDVRVDVGGAAGNLKLLSFSQDNRVSLGQRDHGRRLWYWIKRSKSTSSWLIELTHAHCMLLFLLCPCP